MQKIIGSIIVLIASAAIGFEKSRELQMNVNEQETLKHIFVLLKKEMQYTRDSIPELLMKISKKTEGKYSEWLRELADDLHHFKHGTFEDVWNCSIEKWFRESQLTKEEKEELCQVGKSLGYIEVIDIYLEQLEVAIQRTREESKNKKKLYQSMGILGGIFLVIVFF